MKMNMIARCLESPDPLTIDKIIEPLYSPHIVSRNSMLLIFDGIVLMRVVCLESVHNIYI